MIPSPCSIVFTPAGGSAITLASDGGWLAAMPRFEATQAMYEMDGVELANAHFEPLGGVRVSITLETVRDTELPHDALIEAEMHGAGVLTGMTGALVLSGDEGTVTYSPAVIQSIRPGLPIDDPPVLTRVFRIVTVLPVIA